MGEMAKPITHIPTTLQMGRRGHWGLNGRAVPHTHTYTDTYKVQEDDDDDDDDGVGDDVGVKMTELAVEGHISYAHLLFERWSL